MDDVISIAQFVLICSSIILVWLQIRQHRRRDEGDEGDDREK